MLKQNVVIKLVTTAFALVFSVPALAQWEVSPDHFEDAPNTTMRADQKGQESAKLTQGKAESSHASVHVMQASEFQPGSANKIIADGTLKLLYKPSRQGIELFAVLICGLLLCVVIVFIFRWSSEGIGSSS